MANIEWDASRRCITVTGLPDVVAVETLAEKLHQLIMERQLQGVTEVHNLSEDDGETRFLTQLKRGADAQPVLDAIFRNLPPA